MANHGKVARVANAVTVAHFEGIVAKVGAIVAG